MDTLYTLWQKWREQALLGQWILENEDQIQLVSKDIQRIGSLGNFWNPIRSETESRLFQYNGDDFGGFGFASFLRFFIKYPADYSGQPDVSFKQLPHWTKTLVQDSVEDISLDKSPLHHLMDWAETTLIVLAETGN